MELAIELAHIQLMFNTPPWQEEFYATHIGDMVYLPTSRPRVWPDCLYVMEVADRLAWRAHS